MSGSSFLDANVWLALIWDGHMHSATARAWFDRAGDHRFFYCRLTQIAVLRLLTTASVMGRDVQSMRGAWTIWDRIASDECIAFLPEPEDLEPRFRRHSRLGSSSPKVWADAYLLAYALATGVTLVTFDRALASHTPNCVVLE